MRPLWSVAAAALALVLAGASGCGEPSGPGRLDDLLDVMPSEPAARGLFYTRVDERAPGFGSVLPLGRADELLGIGPADVTDMLETGGAPLTVLAGRFRAGPVAEAVQAHGYVTEDEEAGGWTVFTRGGAEGDAGPLAAAVPAGAVRRGLIVLGDAAEVRAAVAGGDGAGRAAALTALSRSVGDATAVALLPSPQPIVDAAAAEGGPVAALERGGGRGALPAWDAAALAWTAQADDDGSNGAVLLAFDRPVDGHEAARVLVLRAATTPLLGEGRRSTADLFERGAPRWEADPGVVRLPVRWRAADPAALRQDLDEGALLFLAPGDAG